jgi:hypothetical protein
VLLVNRTGGLIRKTKQKTPRLGDLPYAIALRPRNYIILGTPCNWWYWHYRNHTIPKANHNPKGHQSRYQSIRFGIQVQSWQLPEATFGIQALGVQRMLDPQALLETKQSQRHTTVD